MGVFVRTGRSGSIFASYYKEVETKLKEEKKFLDSKHKRICEEILKEGDPFWGKVEAKSFDDYEKMVNEYLKNSKKEMTKVDDFLEKAKAKAA